MSYPRVASWSERTPGARSRRWRCHSVADDDRVTRKALCEMFEIEKDYDICAEAVNGQEAIALATKHRPDLVILDLSMPVMNGYDAGK
jgi:CheY-like chemotaxis protein